MYVRDLLERIVEADFCPSLERFCSRYRLTGTVLGRRSAGARVAWHLSFLEKCLFHASGALGSDARTAAFSRTSVAAGALNGKVINKE